MCKVVQFPELLGTVKTVSTIPVYSRMKTSVSGAVEDFLVKSLAFALTNVSEEFLTKVQFPSA
jgi:hypothetical protein